TKMVCANDAARICSKERENRRPCDVARFPQTGETTMSRRLAVVAALFAITACDRPTAPTSALSADLKLASAAGTKTNEWQPISGTAVNTCNGEDVFLSGSVHLVTTMSTTNTGTRVFARSDAGEEHLGPLRRI